MVDRAAQPGRSGLFELIDVSLDHPRGGAPLLSDARFAATRGEVVVILATAGAGTSRLVAAALGDAPYIGRIAILGRDIAKLRRTSLRLLRRRIGVVPQDLCLMEDRSVQHNVALPLEIDCVSRSESAIRTAEMLVRLGLASDAALPVSSLSSSARQRVAIARALIREPQLVLADQPMSLQDAAGAELVCEAFAEAAHGGACIVAFAYDSPIRAIAERWDWRQMALVDGRIVPIAQAAFDDHALDDSLLSLDSMPNDSGDDEIPNVVSFSMSSRTTGTA